MDTAPHAPPHAPLRALAAAAAHALVTGRKVAGLYDHAAARERAIAAECRAPSLRGHDGDRGCAFGGTLPSLHDAGSGSGFSLAHEGGRTWGRFGTGGDFTIGLREGLVQLYDHAAAQWFAYDIREENSGLGFVRA